MKYDETILYLKIHLSFCSTVTFAKSYTDKNQPFIIYAAKT